MAVGLASALLLGSRHKVFVSYHHADEVEVRAFINTYDHGLDSFISRGIGANMPGDVIDSTNTDYVMGRIRTEHLRDSTVTMVMIGKCTWSRRHCDWEIQASLRRGPELLPNGLMAIELSTFADGRYPERLNNNLLSRAQKAQGVSDCYARVYPMPASAAQLHEWIEDAFRARTTRASLISNPRDSMKYNRDCGHSWH